jgi:fibrillarin-like pre-rRNA processing protein
MMKNTNIQGVFKEKNQIFTKNPKNCKRYKVYNERIIKLKNEEYRSWNPYRSKLAAAILNKLEFKIQSDMNILYLGAATGTTVSHISDIISDGLIYAIENSPVAMKKLLDVCEKRKNILPILENANHPERYTYLISQIDFIYQDISQRNQAEIFITNTERYLKKGYYSILMVKARSIDVSLKPKEAYGKVQRTLKENGLKIVKIIDLSPYEKDHAAFLITK